MYNQKPPSRPTDNGAGNGSGSKFQNKNIGNSYKAPPGAATRSAPGMTVVRGNKGVGRAIGGAAAPTASMAPIPLNTPSVKRENNGRDPSVNILPSRNAGIWGQGGSAEDGSSEPRHSSQPAPVASKPAPWAKPAAGAEQSAETANKPAPTTRAPATNWADVDVDSDEDDDAAPPAHAPAPQPASSNPAQGTHWAPTETSHPSFGFGTASFGQNQGQGQNAGPGPADPGHRKERSGSGSFNDSFGGGDQRRFGGFGNAPYGSQQDDGRFGSRPFGSNDARFGGPPPGDFGRPGFGAPSYTNSPSFGGMSGNPNNLMRGNPGFNNAGRPGPDRSFGHMSSGQMGNPGFNPTQRPPAGGNSFGQNASIFGHSGGYYGGQGAAGGPSGADAGTAEQRAIETARYELELLEAKKLRKRTMSGDEFPPADALNHAQSGNNAMNNTAGAYNHNAQLRQPFEQQQQQRERDFGGGGDARGSYGGAPPGGNMAFANNNGNRRDFGNSSFGRGRDEPYGGGMNAGANGNGPPGYGYGGADVNAARIPHRTRGPSVDAHTPDLMNPAGRNPNPGGGYGMDGLGYGVPPGQQQQQQSSEQMWERVKRPVADPPGIPNRQQQPQHPGSGFSASNPFVPPPSYANNADMSSNSDRWATRQPLPPPPALHMNAHFMNMQGGMGMQNQAALQRQERERGPRTGLTPRDNRGPYAEQELLMQQGSRAPEDRSAQQSADPNKPYASFFGRPGASEEHVASRDTYPLPQEGDAYRQHQAQQQQQARPAYAQAQEQAMRQYAQPVYDADQRAPPPGSPGTNRPKMLYDPQSNAFRELATAEKEVAKPGMPNKSIAKKPDSADVSATSGRKVMQVDRIEHNDKWDRQALPKEAPQARAPKIITKSADAPASRTVEISGGVADDYDDTVDHRQEELAARKEARAKERAERGPRTKGFLFHYNAEGQIERLFTPEEKIRADALKARKAEKERKLAEESKSLAVTSVDNLPLRLSNEQFKALTPEQKQELKARQESVRAAREAARETVRETPAATSNPASSAPIDTSVQLTAEEYRALSKEQKQELKAKQREEKEARAKAAAAKREKRREVQVTDSLSSLTLTGAGELDIQKVAQEADAHRSQQPVKAFVPGQQYARPAESQDSWQRGAEHHRGHQQQQPQQWEDVHAHRQDLYPPSVPRYAEPQQDNSWRSYAPTHDAAPEPALFGGNTAFLGVLGHQETSLGSRFAALQNARPEADLGARGANRYNPREEQGENYPATRYANELAARERGGRGGRGDARERPERESGGRGRGGRARSGPPAFESADAERAAHGTEGAGERPSRGGRGGRGRGGRGSEEAGDGADASAGPGAPERGGRGRGRGRGRGGDSERAAGEEPHQSSGGRGERSRFGRGRGEGKRGPPADTAEA